MTKPRHLDDRLARLALSQLGEPGDERFNRLAHEHGASRLHLLLSEQRGPGGVLDEVAARLAVSDPERDLDRASRLGIRWVVPGDAEWPTDLDDLDRAPPLLKVGRRPLGLWVRGPLRLDQLPRSVAVVGSRSSTTYGESVARDIAADLTQAGLGVVSGAAFGIDQAAHRGALTGGGPTVAALACGLDRAYPLAHRELLDHIGATGALVSELAPGRAPTRLRFLSRNRLIAALSVGTVVVEAAIRSGALNTANWAGRLNRTLMCVPGPVTSAQSQGAHHLIRSGAASLVTNGPDVLEEVSPAGAHLQQEPRAPERRRDRLDPTQRRVLEAVPLARAAPSDSIARTAGLGLIAVGSALGALHELGLVVGGRGGWRLAEGATAS